MHPDSDPPRQVPDLSPRHREIDLYCRYLTGQPADEKSQLLFTRAVELGVAPLELRGENILRFLLNNEWCFGCVDAALGVFLPQHEIRQRMMLAFAVLEANPIYFDVFRPRPFSQFHAVTLAFKGLGELVKAVLGRILLGCIRCR